MKPNLDFNNFENAFDNQSNAELKRTYWLFRLINKQWLVNILNPLGELGLKLRIPFVETSIYKTMFHQFCGGRSLEESTESIKHLADHKVGSILDYGVEGKSQEEDLENTLQENVKAIQYAASEETVPVMVIKITGLADNDLLINIGAGKRLSDKEKTDLAKLENRLELLAGEASKLGVGIFVDAEESWLQNAIDILVLDLMEKFNKEKVVIYQTYQLYRKDKLDQLKRNHATAEEKGFKIGAKLVRGAYMNKEANRARVLGIKSPIQDSKEATDAAFNEALFFCLDRYENLAFCCASHNALSNMMLAQAILDRKIQKDHPHINFCQLYGMSDNITFNLAAHGYNVAKYVVYGPVQEVFPYLTRRAKENSSITGDMSRELSMVYAEMKRRGLK